MGYFYRNFILAENLVSGKDLEFLIDFHQTLSSKGINIVKDSFIIFNDTSDENEEDEFEIVRDETLEIILKRLTDWSALGRINYTSNDLKIEFGCNFLSWEGEYIEGIIVSVDAKLLKEHSSINAFNALTMKVATTFNSSSVYLDLPEFDLPCSIDKIISFTNLKQS